MSKIYSTHNVVELIRRGLSESLKEVLTEELVADELASFEVRLRETIKPTIERVSLEHVDRVVDMMSVRDELNVHIRIREAGNG